MLMLKITLVFLCAIFAIDNLPTALCSQYEPTWDSLNKRPLPSWINEAKLGIWLTWGVYSVPSFGSEWFWLHLNNSDPEYVDFMKKNYPPNFKYEDFAKQLTAEFFNPTEWAKRLDTSGAKFVILTAKHFDGYALWPSKSSNKWNSMDVSPRKDLVGEIANAVKANTKLKFGLHYWLSENFNPTFLADKVSGFNKSDYVNSKVYPELSELVEKYKPEILLTDGPDEATPEYWKAKEFLAWLYNKSPVKDTIVTNELLGAKRHGDMFARGNKCHIWYKGISLDRNSMGYRRLTNAEDILTPQELIQSIVQVISSGGIAILNIGPTKEGTITPIYQKRLNQMSAWLKVKTKPWKKQIDINEFTYYTTKNNFVYAISTQWPKDNNTLVLKHATKLFTSSTKATLLGGNGQQLKWTIKCRRVELSFPDISTVNTDWAYVVKIEN